MTFFRRESHEPPDAASNRPASPSQAAGGRDRPVTRIAEGTRIQGEVGGSTELVLEGELEGRIQLDGRLVVGSTGRVRGQVSARVVVVAGTITGDVRGAERVEVGASANLQGDISSPRVTIAEGAFFKGKVEMSGEAGARRGAAGAPGAEAAAGAEPRPGEGAPGGQGG